MTQNTPQNVLLIYTMTGNLLNGQGPNAWQPVYWDNYNEPDWTGENSGYFGQLQNIAISAVQQISSSTNQAVVPTSPAGGDLTGNYPNPTIGDLQGNPVSVGTLGAMQDGYVLSWSQSLGQLVMRPTVSGSAGGDLSGQFPNPTVAKIQGNPVSSQTLGSGQDGYVLLWNGTQWLASDSGSGITLGGDLSGNSTSQVVVGLQSHAIATTTPIPHAVPVWDSTLSHYDIRQLTADDIGAGFEITGFSGGSIVEMGATVTNPSFTASYNATPSSASIVNSDSIDSPLVLSAPYTSGTVTGSFHHTTQTNVTFTLGAVGSSTQTAEQYIQYLPRSFGGVGAAGATDIVTAGVNTAILSNSDVLGNLGLFSTDVGQTFGPFSPSGQKIYLLLTGGSHTFMSGGFSFAFNSPTAVSFTNQNSAVVSMYLYESTNLLSASFSILVSS